MIFRCKTEGNPKSSRCRGMEKLAMSLPSLGGVSDMRCSFRSVFHLGVLVMEVLETGWNFQQIPPRPGSLQIKH